MTEKKNLKRRTAAVALAVVGVAGLTMAAAAQLQLTWSGGFQAGAATIAADCQPEEQEITVGWADPTFTGSASVPWAVEAVTFSGIDDSCEDKSYEVAYRLGSADWVSLDNGSVSGSSITADLGSVDPYAITQVALTIHD